MKRLLVITLAIVLAGCGGGPAPAPPSAPATVPAVPQPAAAPVTASAAPAAAPAPAGPVSPIPQPGLPSPMFSRDEIRDQLQQWLDNLPGDPAQQLDSTWVAADLDGNGESEYVMVHAVEDGRNLTMPGAGAALFVIYRQDGRWRVDRSDLMPDRMELELMPPKLYGVADIAGAGHPQVVWGRPEVIATGPQPYFIFVTSWKPGQFTQLPGTVALSYPQVAIEGREIVLTGVSRQNTYLPVMRRTDRYRVVDGALRLVDRRFVSHPDDGYARLWDGLVAEDSGRLPDAEAAYREAADPARQPHSGWIEGYHMEPRKLSTEELGRFGEALRAFAGFRLGALLLGTGRPAQGALAGGAYAELINAVRSAGDRDAACKAGQAWAAAHPEFLQALNLGVGTAPWTPDLICSHDDIDDHGFWEGS